MTSITLSDALANDTLSGIATALDAGSGTTGATVGIYSGTKPDKPDTAITSQVLLGTLTCQSTCGAVANRALTFNSITQDAEADDTGTATWARFFNKSGTAVVDVDVSTLGGTAFLKMNTTNIVAGGPITITSCVITV